MHKALVLALALAPALSACGDDTPVTHVACVGDSITFGDGASAPQETYPGALQGMMGPKVTVKNFGHNGATALGAGAGELPYESEPEYAAATSFVSEAGAGARVAVVILLGANDSRASNWDAPGHKERFATDYGKLIDHFAGLASHPKVYVATPLGTGPKPCCGIRGEILTKEVTPAVRAVAQSHAATVVDLSEVIAGHPELLADGVHPTDKGYERLAETVKDAVLAQPPPATGSFWSRLFH